MNIPLVSVIIPTYKSRGGLVKSIDSVLAQTYRNIEVIVIDDNDSHTPERKSTEIQMEKYASNYKVIYLKHDINKNGAAARNTGIYHSTGDYIAFLDDDDEWLPNKISKQIDFLSSHSDFDAVYTHFISGNKIPYIIPYVNNAIIPLLMGRTRMYTSTLLMTRKSVLAINGFDESFRRHQDYEFLIRFFKHGFKIGYMNDVLVRYTPLGGNSPLGKEYELLKDKFLNTFGTILTEIDNVYPSKKKEIIVSNYALVFYSDISHKLYKHACHIFVNYFKKAPLAFISQIFFMIKSKILTKRNNEI